MKIDIGYPVIWNEEAIKLCVQSATGRISRMAVLCDGFLRETEFLEKLKSELSRNDIDFFFYTENENLNRSKELIRLAGFLASGQCQGILSFGTGTIINAGRIASLIFEQPQQIHGILDGELPLKQSLPCWEIPVSGKYHHAFHNWLPVIDSRSRELKAFQSAIYRPEMICLEPQLVRTVSGKSLVFIFLDLVTAFVEGLRYAGRNTLHNDVLDAGMKSFVPLFEGLINIERTKEFHEQYSLAAYYTAKSICFAGIGPVMALSFALQAYCPSGRTLINAVLLPYFLDILAELSPAAPARLTEYFVKDTLFENDKDRVIMLSDEVRKCIALYDLPVRLRDLGLTLANIKLAVENLPRFPHYEKRNRDELKKIMDTLTENAY